MSEREPSPQTIATLDTLDDAQWFSRVGVEDLHDAIVLSSWDEAIASATSNDWENAGQEAFNRLREKILGTSKERFNEWNTVVETVKPFSNALASDHLEFLPGLSSVPKIIKDCVEWDLLGLCMECEYSDIIQPGFFHSLSFYYMNGHFPCGIKQETKDNTIIVF